ncbi:MAG: (Na+)-NQR maturation NqrM [Azoarcus sp.]|nr:(Na+)-NQR maturation NqrM [Azoarcus sp.]
MSTFFITLGIVVVIVALMAVGIFFGRRPITGSCGGLAVLGLKCGCENPCEKKRARMHAQAGQESDGEGKPPLTDS